MKASYLFVLYKIKNTKKARLLYESKIIIGVYHNGSIFYFFRFFMNQDLYSSLNKKLATFIITYKKNYPSKLCLLFYI